MEVILQKIKYIKTKLIIRFNNIRSSSSMYMLSFSMFPLLNLEQYLLIENNTPTSIQKTLVGLVGIFIIELWTFLSVVGYLIALYIIKYTDIEKKYPKLQIIINYYKNTNYFFIIFEVLFFIIFNLCLIFLYLHLLYLTYDL